VENNQEAAADQRTEMSRGHRITSSPHFMPPLPERSNPAVLCAAYERLKELRLTASHESMVQKTTQRGLEQTALGVPVT